jgi:hypothetical protein
MTSNDAINPSCPICQDTGFTKGKLCFCITGEKPYDLPDGWEDIFGDILRGKKDEKRGK